MKIKQPMQNGLRSKKAWLVIVAALCFGLVLGYTLRGDETGSLQTVSPDVSKVLAVDGAQAEFVSMQSQLADNHMHGEPAAPDNKTGTVYICPMNCVPPMSQPGQCPVCGMDLVAMEAGEQQGGNLSSRLVLSPQAVELADIRTAPVEKKFVTADIRLYGKIEYDPVEQYRVTAYAPGVIDNIYVKRAGQVVRKGDPLFDLNSAELYYLEQEFFEVLEKLPYDLSLRPGKFHSNKRVGRWSRLLLPPKEAGEQNAVDQEKIQLIQKELEQVKRKMKLLGLSEQDIEGLIVKGRPTGIATITTPMTGVVLKQDAFRGTFVNTGDVVFTIANPRVLWARLDAYASDFPWIRLGQEAEFETDAYPGMRFTGKVLYLDPEFDDERLVFKVGVLYNDKKGLLKPNMLVRCVIHATLTAGGRGSVEIVTQGMMGTAQTRRTDEAPLVIPDTAPLITGKRAVVYVQVPDTPGTYVGREVTLGPRADGYYVVNDGLHKGEMVVVNGNFKIDSAIQILAKTSMMSHESSEMPFDQFGQVKTPPLPKELQGEASGKGAKFEIYADRRPTVSGASSEATIHHAASQNPAEKSKSKEHNLPSPQNMKSLPPAKIAAEARCPVCGMWAARYVKWHTQIVFSDGGYRAFDGCKDMFTYLFEMAKFEKKYTAGDIAAIYVKDFSSGKWIDAQDASYVIGSNISGPMGSELIPVENQEQAMKIVTASGGRVINYIDVTMDMIQSVEPMQHKDMHTHK